MATEELTLITYSEIALKSPPVRRILELQLAQHITFSLKQQGIDATVRRIRGRLIAESKDTLAVAETASRVFGVSSAIPAVRVDSSLDAIVEAALNEATKTLGAGQTFAVRARRVGKQEYSSKDVEVRVGAEILERLKTRGIRVSLDDPDVTIGVEVRDGDAYVYSRIIRGFSGLPYGSQGELVSLFSGGIDSPVAAWFVMKRGASVVPLFFDQRPFVGEDYYARAVDVAKKLRQYVPLKNYALHVAHTGEIMREIAENVPVKLTCVVCKRMMYRIACGLAEKINADGIVTGESLGQVASQTLRNLRVLDESATLPVYRPLIGFEKLDIVAWAKMIGTYDSSTVKIHGCSVVPSEPSTRARLENVLEAEKAIPADRLVSDSLEELTRVEL